MKIGLIDVDGHKDIFGHKFPNLALMKISAYHKSIGDSVEWYSGLDYYDIVYMSKVFTFTPDFLFPIAAMIVHKGGTGYNAELKLSAEIDKMCPDYSLYPFNKYYDQNTAYGFITRGCIRKCPWCVVLSKRVKLQLIKT